MSNNKIILLPWEHDANANLHLDILDYIKALPDRSIIALEVSPDIFFEFQILLDIFAGHDPRGRFSRGREIRIINEIYAHPIDFLHRLANQYIWAVFEVMLEARKRNQIMLPIENKSLYHEVTDLLLNKNLLPVGLGSKLYAEREEFFLEKIVDAYKRTNQDVHVVAGLGHTLGLKSALEKLGMPVLLKVDFSRINADVVRKLIEISAEISKLAKELDESREEGNIVRVNELLKRQDELAVARAKISAPYHVSEEDAKSRLDFKIEQYLELHANRRLIHAAYDMPLDSLHTFRYTVLGRRKYKPKLK